LEKIKKKQIKNIEENNENKVFNISLDAIENLEKVKKEFGTINHEIIYRKNINGLRHYVKIDDENNITGIAISVTSMISKIQGVPTHLLKWACDKGSFLEYRNVLNELAGFGTLCHSEMPNILKGEILPLDSDEKIIERILKFQEKNQEYFKYDFIARLNDYKNFMNALYVFFIDMFKQGWKCIGCEVPLANWDLQLAGCLDLVFQNGDKFLVADFKSGKSETEEHELQLLAYRDLLCHNYPHIKKENVSIANIYTKDYQIKTLNKYLNGESKTTPYKFIEREINPKNVEWLNFIIKRYRDINKIEPENLSEYLTIFDKISKAYLDILNKKEK
jgi:hypothetical protein